MVYTNWRRYTVGQTVTEFARQLLEYLWNS